MKPESALRWLVPVIGILALVAAGAGLFWQAGGGPFSFATLHGQTVQMDGRGLYRNDTLFSAAAFRATDTVTLLVSLPLLVIAFVLYGRGSLRGRFLLAGALSYFLYIGASMTFGAAFNSLFLVYAALFSASLFAFIAALTTIDAQTLPDRVSPRLPHRGMAVFMFIAGLGTLFIWLSDLLGPLLAGRAPELLGPYTTMFTYGFDTAVITPAAVLTGVGLLRRKPVGYLLVAPILILCILNGLLVIASTVSQTMAGIVFPIGVYIGMIGSWVVMGAFAAWLAVAFLQGLSESPPERAATWRVARAGGETNR
jgi:hypothetical protein